MFLLDTGILFLFYHYRVYILKQNSAEKIINVRSGLGDENFTLLAIPQHELNNPEIYSRINESEFIYRGDLYDLVSYTEKNDSSFIVCIHDADEEAFNRSFTGIIDNYNNYKKLRRLNLYQTEIILNQVLPNEAIFFPPVKINLIFAGNEMFASQNIIDIPSPPPKYS
jgi:hypothetical protein